MYFLKSFVALLLFFTCLKAVGQPLISIKDSKNGGYIGKNVSLFQDSSSNMTFEQVKDMPALFKRSGVSVPNLGISHSTHWIKFTLTNSSNNEDVVLNLSNPVIDQACLFLVRSGGGVDSICYNNKQA